MTECAWQSPRSLLAKPRTPTVQRLAPILPDDVGVRLEDRNDLLRRWDGLVVEHTAARLLEHLRGELDVMLKCAAQLVKVGCFERFARIRLDKLLDGDARGLDGDRCEMVRRS